ncbi:SRPBCC family protein [Nocardioides halotolerans]|uniref:SRPBCC family protein n=1 Tax=Nocardioides halotolerans TaxID=433660 RepID=UPI00056D2438|nr:SRPBCC family protein [Nocardioides halotolerans]
MAEKNSGMDALKDASQQLLGTLGDRALSEAHDRIGGLTDKLGGIAGGGPAGQALAKGAKAKAEGGSGLLGGVKGAVSGVKDKVVDTVTGGGGGKGKGGDATSSTNIIESIDVGVPLSVAYNQWTEFGSFPSFMKKVENVDAESEEKLTFKAQIFLSHRTWEATVLEQVPDERIVWRSKGEKGHVDGAVTFHELAPNLTRILVVLEYYPQGLFEKTGNLWRAQGRRARAELRHFRRHVMTRTVLDPDEVEGWRGVIHDGEVVESHEEHVQREEEEADSGEDGAGDEYDDEYDESDDESGEIDGEDDDEADDEPEDEYDEDEYDDEGADDEDDEAEDDEAEDDEPEDEYDEDEYDDEGADDEDDEAEDDEAEDDEPEDEYDEDEYDDEDDAEGEDDEPEDDEPEDDYDDYEEDEEDVEEDADDVDDVDDEDEPTGRRSSRRRAS